MPFRLKIRQLRLSLVLVPYATYYYSCKSVFVSWKEPKKKKKLKVPKNEHVFLR
jgi:hypothetical protein